MHLDEIGLRVGLTEIEAADLTEKPILMVLSEDGFCHLHQLTAALSIAVGSNLDLAFWSAVFCVGVSVFIPTIADWWQFRPMA